MGRIASGIVFAVAFFIGGALIGAVFKSTQIGSVLALIAAMIGFVVGMNNDKLANADFWQKAADGRAERRQQKQEDKANGKPGFWVEWYRSNHEANERRRAREHAEEEHLNMLTKEAAALERGRLRAQRRYGGAEEIYARNHGGRPSEGIPSPEELTRENRHKFKTTGFNRGNKF